MADGSFAAWFQADQRDAYGAGGGSAGALRAGPRPYAPLPVYDPRAAPAGYYAGAGTGSLAPRSYYVPQHPGAAYSQGLYAHAPRLGYAPLPPSPYHATVASGTQAAPWAGGPGGALAAEQQASAPPPGAPVQAPASAPVHAPAALQLAERRALELADKLSAAEKLLATEQRERRADSEAAAEAARVQLRAATDEATRLRDAEADAKSACGTAQRCAARESARADSLARELTVCREDASQAARQASEEASRAAGEACAALSRARADAAARQEDASRALAAAAESERQRAAAAAERDALRLEAEALRAKLRARPTVVAAAHTAVDHAAAGAARGTPSAWLAALEAAAAAAEASGALTRQPHASPPQAGPPPRFVSLSPLDVVAGSSSRRGSRRTQSASAADDDDGAPPPPTQAQALAQLVAMQAQAARLTVTATEDRPPRPDSAASTRSWSSLAESDPPSPTEEAQHPFQPFQAQAQAQGQQGPPALPLRRASSLPPDPAPAARGAAVRSSPPQQQQQQQQQLLPVRVASPSPARGQGSPYTGPSAAAARPSPPPSEPQQQQLTLRRATSAPPPPTGHPVEHWMADEDPWDPKRQREEAAYHSWLQEQARRGSRGSGRPASPQRRDTSRGSGPNVWGRMTSIFRAKEVFQSAGSRGRSSSMPARPGSHGSLRRPTAHAMPQGLPQGYYDDEYEPQGYGGDPYSVEGGRGDPPGMPPGMPYDERGGPRGILRASSFTRTPPGGNSAGSSNGGAGWGSQPGAPYNSARGGGRRPEAHGSGSGSGSGGRRPEAYGSGSGSEWLARDDSGGPAGDHRRGGGGPQHPPPRGYPPYGGGAGVYEQRGRSR